MYDLHPEAPQAAWIAVASWRPIRYDDRDADKRSEHNHKERSSIPGHLKGTGLMEILILVLVGTFLSWISLVILIAIGQGLADLSVPPWPETLWKLAVIAAVVDVLTIALPLHPLLTSLIVAVVFWIFMVKWFQVDLLGAIILVVLSMVIRWAMLAAIFSLA